MDQEFQIGLAAFEWLSEQTDLQGDVLDRDLIVCFLSSGVNSVCFLSCRESQWLSSMNWREALISPRWIFKPAILELPLTITTVPNAPYDDRLHEGQFLQYKYRGTDTQHPDNVGLRKLMEQSRPLIYFYGLVPSRYMAVWPVYIIGDRPHDLTFEVAVEDIEAVRLAAEDPARVAEGAEPRRVYATSTVRSRLHQRSFRERVIRAYRETCSLCRLRHRELLDAAHIVSDVEEGGAPVVNNGISLCKLHHAAFDRFMVGVTLDVCP